MPRPRDKRYIAIENRLDHYPALGEKRERNEELVRDYLLDMSAVDMVIKHRITLQRIYQIIGTYRWIGARTGVGVRGGE